MSLRNCLLTLSLAGSGLAVVLERHQRNPTLTNPTLTRRENETLCNPGDTSTTEGVQAILDSTGAIDWLDIMLNIYPEHESDWVDKIWDFSFPHDGRSPLSGCGQIGSDCEVENRCSQYPNEMAYWSLQSVESLHSKIDTISNKLLWTGFLDSLSIDQIGKDFSEPAADNTWAKWLSAAFSMAGGFATGVDISKPLRGMVGMASAGFTDVSLANLPTDTIDTASVKVSLQNLLSAVNDQVSGILNNATGNGDSTLLPIYTESTLQYGTTRFFSDNTILLDQNKDNSSFEATYTQFGKNLEQKIVDIAIKSGWYILLAEDDVAQSDCNMNRGSLWLQANTTWACFYLSHPKWLDDCTNNDPTTCVADAWEPPYSDNHKMDTAVYDKMIDTYGFDLTTYYQSLIDCHLNGDGTLDTTNFSNNNSIPRCFYSVPVYRGSWYSDDTALLNLYFDKDQTFS